MRTLSRLVALLLMLQGHLISFAQSITQKQVLVYFKQGVQKNAPPNQNTVTISSPGISQLLNNYGLSTASVRPTFPAFYEADTINADIGEISRQVNWSKIFTISLPDTSFKSALLHALNHLPEVLYAEGNGDAATNLVPADGRFGQQWNLQNPFVPGADIHAVPAWDIYTGNPNSIIAVIDAGVDINHTDLAAKITGGDNGFLIQTPPGGQQFSHGTHVAGIAAAVTNNNNNNGVAGVDWQARIYPRYVIGNNSGDGGVSQAIIDAVNFSPNVWTLNHSWELINTDLSPGRYSVTVRAAFAHAYRNNRVSCVAMGNSQQGFPNVVAFPAGFNSGIIAVGATDFTDGIALFSSQGAHIDVSAPGVDILSTNFNNDYVMLSGTSMATPHVSGLASLLKGFNTNLANDDIEQIIRLSSDDRGPAGFDNAFGTGRINAQRALQDLQAPNQLLHWSVTGGTIFNTSGSEQRIFLGMPGLADAAYVVKRSEVRANVNFPAAMCTMIGAWGRGIGTTGYREEFGRSFGEGICEVVPGTLTNTSATLRTWIYEVWAINGQYLGFYPRSAGNVVFQYSVLGVPVPTTVTGDNVVCNTSGNYSIGALPAGSTILWQASPSGIVTINSPNSPQTTITQNNNAGIISLSATITNTCAGGIITLTKNNIVVGTPKNYYVSGSEAFYIYGNMFDYAPNGPGNSLSVCPGELLMFTPYFPPANTTVVTAHLWSVSGVTAGTLTAPVLSVTAPPVHPSAFSFTYQYQNACGWSPVHYGEAGTRNCAGGEDPFRVIPGDTDSSGLQLSSKIMVFPNPASTVLSVTIPAAGLSPTTIIIYDIYGRLVKKVIRAFKNTSINIANWQRGTYIVEIFDGTRLVKKKIIKD